MATDNATNPYHHFLRLVWKMRKTQKDYFKFKSRAMLESSKRLEADVDKWLEQCGMEAAKIRQLGLETEEPRNEG